jgi:hypothetical protein
MTATPGAPVTLTLDPRLAEALSGEACAASLYFEYPDQFEYLRQTDDLGDPVFREGTMRWCDTAADAVLLHAFQLAAGHRAVLLWDLDRSLQNIDEGRSLACHIVLSTDPWPYKDDVEPSG